MLSARTPPRELTVHMASGVEVGESMARSSANPLQAYVLAGQQNDIVDRAQPGTGGERVEKPRPDHPVVDNGVAARGQAAGGGRRGPNDDLILPMRGRRPRIDIPLIDHGEELIACHHGAVIEQL